MRVTFILLLGLMCLAPQLHAQVVIVNNDNPTKTLTVNSARALFSTRVLRWPNQTTAVAVVVLPDNHALHRTFSRKVLAMLPHQLRRNWDRFVYSGIGQAPITVNSIETMIEIVATTPGAIGYLPEPTSDRRVKHVPLL